MRLNVGSGPSKGWDLERWVNIDCQRLKNVIPMDPAHGLGFRDDTFDEIRVIHVLEHVTRENHLQFLEELLRVLKPRGIFYVEVPNLPRVCKFLYEAHKKGDEEEAHRWIAAIYGKHRRPGDGHAWGFTSGSLEYLVRSAGFDEVTSTVDWVSGHHKQGPVYLVKGTKWE